MVSYLCPIRALSALLKWCLVKIPGDQILLEMLDKRKMIFFITISPVSMQITVSYLLTAYHSRGSKRGKENAISGGSVCLYTESSCSYRQSLIGICAFAITESKQCRWMGQRGRRIEL